MGRTVTQFLLNSSTFFDMKFLALSVILALAVALSSAASVDQAFASQWQNFKSLHGKSYDATEEKLRIQIFSANMDRISRHNARYMKGEVSYSMGMNQFGDLTTEEFSKLHKATESSYSYEGRQGSCRYSSAYSAGVSVSGYMSIRRGDESNLLSAVSSNGPVSVCINASSSGFQFYTSGVFNDPYCSSQINHAVLAVGYGSENGDDYWLVKNSWGTGWGDNGYIKMSRNRSNQCGIANQACYPY